MRFRVVTAVVSVCALVLCPGASPRASASAGEWPKAFFDNLNSGFDPHERGIPADRLRRVHRRWQAHLVAIARGSPAVAGGRVYVTGMEGHGTGVEALSAATGRLVWLTPLDNGIDAPPTVSGGRVYVGADSAGDVYALDARTGRVLWRAQTGATNIYAGATVAGGLVYLSPDDGKLYAFDAATGAVRWTANVDSEYATPAYANGTLYTWGGSIGNVGGIDPPTLSAIRASDGAILWQWHAVHSAASSPLLHGHWTYVADGNGLVYGFDLTHCGHGCNPQWTFTPPTSGSGAFVAGLAYAYGTLFAASADGTVYALNPTSGALRFRDLTGRPISSPPSIAGGVLWIGAQYDLEAFSAHGCRASACTPLWTTKVDPQGEPVDAAPAIADRTVYAVTYLRKLTAYSDG